MAASMYSITIEEICASMAGTLRCHTNDSLLKKEGESGRASSSWIDTGFFSIPGSLAEFRANGKAEPLFCKSRQLSPLTKWRQLPILLPTFTCEWMGY